MQLPQLPSLRPARSCTVGVAVGLTLALGLAAQAARAVDRPAATAPVPPLDGPDWEHTEVAVGAVLHRFRPAELFGRPQAITVLELDPAAVRLRVAATEPWSRRPTSQLVRDHERAVAAINGGFFDTSNGVPDGVVVQAGALRHAASGRVGEGAVVVDAEDRPRLGVDLSPAALAGAREVLSAWPVLLRDGAPGRDGGFDPAGPRHPRSMIGWTAGGRRILLCAVDGRHAAAAGMTFREQAELLRALGCVDALNLDGGGSTTLWTLTGGGIANHPSDNRRFDAAGERAVANALVVVGRAVFLHDEERATPSAGEAVDVDRLARPDAVGGDVLRIRAAAPLRAEAVFRLPIPQRGAAAAAWAVEIHLPSRRDDGGDDPAVLEVDCGEGAQRLEPGSTARWVEIARRPPAGEPLEVRVRAGAAGAALVVDAIRTVEHERTDR